MTKLTRTLLTVAALLIAVSSHAQNKKYAKIDDVYYELNTSDMTASVTQSWGIMNGNEYEGRGSIAIPEKITFDADTYTVTSIGFRAFSNCARLFTVTIPESVTSIEDEAFNWCEDLTTVKPSPELDRHWDYRILWLLRSDHHHHSRACCKYRVWRIL